MHTSSQPDARTLIRHSFISARSVALIYKLYVGSPASAADGALRFVFSSSDATAPVVMGGAGHGAVLLQGQLEALAGMRRGGRRRAVLPPRLGFGATANDRVPPWSTLLCFMELLPARQPPGRDAHDAVLPDARWEDDDELEDLPPAARLR